MKCVTEIHVEPQEEKMKQKRRVKEDTVDRDPRWAAWATGGISKSNSGICTYEEWMAT